MTSLNVICKRHLNNFNCKNRLYLLFELDNEAMIVASKRSSIKLLSLTFVPKFIEITMYFARGAFVRPVFCLSCTWLGELNVEKCLVEGLLKHQSFSLLFFSH